MGERLTKRTENGGVRFSNGEYWNTVYPQNEHCLTDIHRMAIKLCGLEDKIEQGKILELPCKAGYRKSTDVAEKIFAEIETKILANTSDISGCKHRVFAELKKKYIQSEDK
jgi:hypothetical protein